MIQTTFERDNPGEPDWLAVALIPPPPSGQPQVRLTIAVERQMRRRTRMIEDFRRWAADRAAAAAANPPASGSRFRG